MYTCSVVLTASVIEWMGIIGDASAASSATSRVVSLRWIFIKKTRARHSTVVSFSIAALLTVSTNRTFSTKRLRILNNIYRNPAIPNIPLVGTQMWSKSKCSRGWISMKWNITMSKMVRNEYRSGISLRGNGSLKMFKRYITSRS